MIWFPSNVNPSHLTLRLCLSQSAGSSIGRWHACFADSSAIELISRNFHQLCNGQALFQLIRSHSQCLRMARSSLFVSLGLSWRWRVYGSGHNSVRTAQTSADPLRSSQSSNFSFKAIQATNIELVCPVLHQCACTNRMPGHVVPPQCRRAFSTGRLCLFVRQAQCRHPLHPRQTTQPSQHRPRCVRL